jgi:hypothetical protein
MCFGKYDELDYEEHFTNSKGLYCFHKFYNVDIYEIWVYPKLKKNLNRYF